MDQGTPPSAGRIRHALIMAAGGGLSLADRRLRVGAPARRAIPAVAVRA